MNVFPKIKNDIKELDLSEWGKSFSDESYYFSGMANLELINMPANPFSINGIGMFSDCGNLSTIKWSKTKTNPGTNTVITAIGTNAFSGCQKLHEYYIQRMIDDCAGYEADESDEKTHADKNIGEGAFRNCLELGDKDEPEVTNFGVDGTYETEDYANPEELKNASGELIIPSGITGIGKEAFKRDKGQSELKKVTFEYGRTGYNVTIGDYAFDGQGLLKDVELTGGGTNGIKITALGAGAFKNCRAISSNSVNYILESYSANSTSKDGDGNVKIPARLFEGCNGTSPATNANFTELILPANVSEIGMCAFGSWENVDYLRKITVKGGKAPKCAKGKGDASKYDPVDKTVFNGVDPNNVTIVFEGDAAGYNAEGNSGYKTYMADVAENEVDDYDAEFQRLLTKHIYSDVDENGNADYSKSYEYKVVPQQHAIVKLHRKLKAGWNTLCLPFGVTKGAASVGADVKNCRIVKNALNNAGTDTDFMIALYREYVPKQNQPGTFRFLRIYDENQQENNKYDNAEIAAYEPFMVKMTSGDLDPKNTYTFTNVDLNYDYKGWSENNTDYVPTTSDAKSGNRPAPLMWKGKIESGFTVEGGTIDQYAFTGTFVTFQGTVGSSAATEDGSKDDNTDVNSKLTTDDYYIQTKDGSTYSYQYKENDKVRVKAFSAWFHRLNNGTQNSKPANILVNIVGEDNETTEIVNVNPNGDEITTGSVYNINGQLVRANASNMGGLPKGVYIMKGKKFVVK